jgi:hypothetical protein
MEKNKKSVGKYFSGSELSKYNNELCLREALIFKILSFLLPKQKDVVSHSTSGKAGGLNNVNRSKRILKP